VLPDADRGAGPMYFSVNRKTGSFKPPKLG
jgi:hypothetical protein